MASAATPVSAKPVPGESVPMKMRELGVIAIPVTMIPATAPAFAPVTGKAKRTQEVVTIGRLIAYAVRTAGKKDSQSHHCCRCRHCTVLHRNLNACF